MSFYRREFSKEKKWVPFRYSGVGRVLEWRIVESRVTDVTWKTRPDSSIGTPKDVLRLTSGRLDPRYGPPRGPKVTKASFKSSEICSGDLLLWAFAQQSQWSGTSLIHRALIDRPRAPRDPATIYDQSEVLSWSLLVPNTPNKIPFFHSLVETSIWVVSDHRPSWPLLDTCLDMVDGWQCGSLFDSEAADPKRRDEFVTPATVAQSQLHNLLPQVQITKYKQDTHGCEIHKRLCSVVQSLGSNILDQTNDSQVIMCVCVCVCCH